MSSTRCLRLTIPQLRMINAALALHEADDHDADENYRQAVMDRTRIIVWNALGE